MTIKKVLSHIIDNWKSYGVGLLIVLNVVFAGTAFQMFNAYSSTKFELSQANTVINSRIAEIQEFSSKLGRAESDLVRQTDLSEQYEGEIKSFRKEIAKQTDKIRVKDLKIRSRDETIAGLQGQISGGNSSVIIVDVSTGESGSTFETVVDVNEVCGSDKVLAYRWSDKHQRFELFDPDISKSGDEQFKYSQLIRIKGIVLTDSSGNVQVKRVSAEEVIEVEQEGKVSYEAIEGGKVVLVDSKFEYTNEPDKPEGFNWLDPLTLRPMVGFDFPYMTPSIGLEIVNFGRWVPYLNIGLGPKLSFDVSGLPDGDFSSLENSRVGVAAIYHIAPPWLDTNFGLGVSLSTPMNDLDQLMLSVDLTFYLTQDLFPF